MTDRSCEEWFDLVCGRQGGNATPRQLFEFVLREVPVVNFTDRQKDKLRKELATAMFEMRAQYTPSRRWRAFVLLFNYGPFIDLNSEKREDYLEGYEEIIRTKDLGWGKSGGRGDD